MLILSLSFLSTLHTYSFWLIINPRGGEYDYLGFTDERADAKN